MKDPYRAGASFGTKEFLCEGGMCAAVLHKAP